MIAGPALAAVEVQQCPDTVELASPGRTVSHSAIPTFRWTAEPAGTASREVAIFAAHDPSALVVGRAAPFKSRFKPGGVGTYGWFVTFRNAAGKPICRSAIGAFAVVHPRAVVRFSEANQSAPVAPVEPAIYIDANGRYVIVLRGSSYGGQYTTMIDSDDFDGRGYDLGKAIGLEIHGNDKANVVWGSAGHDIIWLYGGNDWAEGGAGDDLLVGGQGNDHLQDIDPYGVNDTDILYGGPGDDLMLVNDGDLNDQIHPGNPPYGDVGYVDGEREAGPFEGLDEPYVP